MGESSLLAANHIQLCSYSWLLAATQLRIWIYSINYTEKEIIPVQLMINMQINDQSETHYHKKLSKWEMMGSFTCSSSPLLSSSSSLQRSNSLQWSNSEQSETSPSIHLKLEGVAQHSDISGFLLAAFHTSLLTVLQ